MEVACSWRCLFVEAASSWELLVHGGSLFITATCQYWWPIYCSGVRGFRPPYLFRPSPVVA
jgi:hypothetical protein